MATSEAMNLVDLAARAGLNPRAVRFYIQRGLLPPPAGLGRGRHYSREHLDTLARIQELQAAGHSLDAIGRILSGQDVETVPPPAPEPSRPRLTLSAELWTRLKAMPGVELHFDATRHQPDVAQLLAVREAIRAAFATNDADPTQSATADERSEI